MRSQTLRCKATSETRRSSYLHEREVPTMAWEISIEKEFMKACGLWRSAPEDVYFMTLCASNYAYVELTFCKGNVICPPKPKHMHKVRVEKGNRIRVRPYLGRGVVFDSLRTYDPDTLVEWFNDKPNTLKIHVPPELTLYQDGFFLGRSSIGRALKDNA